MEQRPLEYTVKIYCEGFTEWYYFEWLRTNNRFKFSMYNPQNEMLAFCKTKCLFRKTKRILLRVPS